MTHSRTRFAIQAVCAALLCSGSAVAAQMTPATTLNTCQKIARNEAQKLARKEMLAIGTCLQKISTEVLKNNAAIDTAAARICVTQFRKINDTRVVPKSFKQVMTTKILNKCQPGLPGVLHTIDDVTGHNSPPLPEQIKTEQLDQWCVNFGGDGSIDTVSEWIDCLIKSHECEARQAIAEQYPRVSEWLTLVQPIMAGLTPPTNDPTKITDAVNGLIAADTAIDSDSDNKPDLQCGKSNAGTCTTACCYQEFGLGNQVSCFEYTGTAGEVSSFMTNCAGKASTPPGAWTMAAAAGVCGNPPDFPTHVACSSGGTPASYVQIPKDSTCP